MTGKKGEFITIKPSQKQLEAAAREVVCKSFEPLGFRFRADGASDTPETVAAIRRHNAAYASYDCGR